MVTRNRSEGSDPPRWWDDLPPRVRDRFAQPLVADAEPRPEDRTAEPPSPLSRGELIGDLSRLAVVFVLIACGNILFLLVALSFVYG
jgi:hypothetical protein